jgi:1,4-alpha-glucan branching enzyme
MSELYHTLVNRRPSEKHIAYAESHDQALVGDKTIAFRLMDADMYWLMTKAIQHNHVIERGMALHKMIRLITFALGGEGYLNFMGNEFGHPEWIDFPREGNTFSFKYARRQWSLVDDPMLRFGDLGSFDREMMSLDEKYRLLTDTDIEKLHIDDGLKLIIFRRGSIVFAFNFNPHASCADYRIGVPTNIDYSLILNTDDLWFGGHSIVNTGQLYPIQPEPWQGQDQSVQIYLPARSAQVLAPRLKWVAD